LDLTCNRFDGFIVPTPILPLSLVIVVFVPSFASTSRLEFVEIEVGFLPTLIWENALIDNCNNIKIKKTFFMTVIKL
jgi:hypothetical protein